eukprot:SAG22_NODE_75_length_22256_cov_45.062960_3_plen_634_part_00
MLDRARGRRRVRSSAVTASDQFAVHMLPMASPGRTGSAGAMMIRIQVMAMSCSWWCSGQMPLASPAEFFVATNGSDAAAGTMAAPFGSIQRCADQLMAGSPAGSTCWLRGGEYRLNTSVLIEGLHGNLTHPYQISGYAGEPVVIDGTFDVGPAAEWTWVAPNDTATGAGHYVTVLADGLPHPWQLFVDGEVMVNARWPNARWDDKTVFRSVHWAASTSTSVYNGYRDPLHGTYSGPSDGSQPSMMVDAGELVLSGGADGRRRRLAGTNSYAYPPLGESGVNATGATAVLNIGHWFSWATSVFNHTPGHNNFTYWPEEGWMMGKYVPEHDIYYLENSLELLDATKEWHYDQQTRQLYLITAGGQLSSPSGMRIQARQLEYAFRVTDSTHLKLSNMQFFACTVWVFSIRNVDHVRHITLDSLKFEYPSATKRMLGDHRHSWPTTLFEKDRAEWCGNHIFNCSWMGSEGDPVVNLRGAGVVMENNLFEYNDWSAVTTVPCWPVASGSLFDIDLETCDPSKKFGGGAFALTPGGGTVENPTTVRRNTIRNIGPSAGIKVEKNTIAELNHMYEQYDIQLDGEHTACDPGLLPLELPRRSLRALRALYCIMTWSLVLANPDRSFHFLLGIIFLRIPQVP